MKKNSGFWIMKAFNGMFFLVTALFIALLAISSHLLSAYPLETRKTVYIIICVITFIKFFAYKYFLSVDEEYKVIMEDRGGFNLWGELPFQLCNINMILMPLSVAFDLRPLMSFAFFAGTLGASIALVMPVDGFSGFPIWKPRLLGYYYNHYMIVMQAIALVSYGFYSPEFRDIPMSLLTLFILSVLAYLFSKWLRVSGRHHGANYFYLIDPEGNPVFEMFRKWIPYELWYGLPCIPVFGIYEAVVIAGFKLAEKLFS